MVPEMLEASGAPCKAWNREQCSTPGASGGVLILVKLKPRGG